MVEWSFTLASLEGHNGPNRIPLGTRQTIQSKSRADLHPSLGGLRPSFDSDLLSMGEDNAMIAPNDSQIAQDSFFCLAGV
jgi:hypothetical protein